MYPSNNTIITWKVNQLIWFSSWIHVWTQETQYCTYCVQFVGSGFLTGWTLPAPPCQHVSEAFPETNLNIFIHRGLGIVHPAKYGMSVWVAGRPGGVAKPPKQFIGLIHWPDSQSTTLCNHPVLPLQQCKEHVNVHFMIAQSKFTPSLLGCCLVCVW